MEIPRIRGCVGQAEPGQGYDGKWFAQVSIWDLTGEHQIGEPIVLGPFDTEELADQAMKDACKICCDEWQKMAGMEPDGKFLDMKAGGVLRPWKEDA